MIVCLSASYKKAKMPLLESLVFKEEDAVMKNLCSEGVTEECALVQTCNRVEIYGVLKDSAEDDSVGRIFKYWSATTGVSLDILTRNVDLLKGREALANLFNVTSGLDSMALGEDQILGQVRTAYAKAKELGSIGMVLDKIFSRAINAGRKVRRETRVNHGSVSISSAAVDLAAKELGDLKRKTALVIGAGEAGSVAAETLRRRGVKSIIVANRTYKTGAQLAKKVFGRAIRFEKIYDVIPRTDLTIVALTVSSPVVKAKSLLDAYPNHRVQRGLFVVDISQPRAVEEGVGSIPGVVLRNIDSLKEIVEESIRNRQTEAEKAKRIVLKELARYEKQQFEFVIQPLISEIFRRVESIRQKELRRALSKMGKQDEKRMGILDRFSRELVERVLQAPIDQLRQAALNSDDGLLSAAEKLFKTKQVENVV
jgi:glutamyl-tRNA reductase